MSLVIHHYYMAQPVSSTGSSVGNSDRLRASVTRAQGVAFYKVHLRAQGKAGWGKKRSRETAFDNKCAKEATREAASLSSDQSSREASGNPESLR